MKIFVCDKKLRFRKLLTALLNNDDTTIVEYDSGKATIEDIKNCNSLPHLIIMSTQLLDLSGFETAKEIKEIVGNQYVPIVFITDNHDVETLGKCLDCGDDFISEHLEPQILSAKLQAHIRTARIYQQLNKSNDKLNYYQNRMEYEHTIAENIFSTLMDNNGLDIDNINYHISPMSTFNGDLLLAKPSPRGGFYVFLGDVSGHGLHSAICTIPASQIFFAMAKKGFTVGQIARQINKTLNQTLPADMMCAAAILEVSPSGDSIEYWMGGLPEGYVIDLKQQIRLEIESTNMPLGVLDDCEFNNSIKTIELQQAEKIYFYSDGIIEASNDDFEMYGEKRLKEKLATPSSDMIADLVNSVQSFSGRSEQNDDITLVEISSGPCHFPVTKNDIEKKLNKLKKAISWQMKIELNIEDFQQRDPIPQINKIIGGTTGLQEHRDIIATIMSEMYTNSLEHGVLELDSNLKNQKGGSIDYYSERTDRLGSLKSGKIEFMLNYRPQSDPPHLRIKIIDSGCGFDVNNIIKEDGEDNFGRGLNIIQSLCSNVTFEDNGRILDATFDLNRS